MSAELTALKDAGLLDPGVLALGVQRGWASPEDAVDFAVEQVAGGVEQPEALDLAGAGQPDAQMVVELLREWASSEDVHCVSSQQASRRWMFALLTTISESTASPEEKLDRLEEAYAALGYPEDMRECSRYYVPPWDRARGIGVGGITASPLEAMDLLLARLRSEFNT